MVSGVVDHKRRDLGLVGVERDRIAGGGGGVALGVGERQGRGDGAVFERMQVGAVGAVAGDAHHHVGVDAVREGDGAGAGIVEPADREGDGGRLRIVDDVIGGVVDHKRRLLVGVLIHRQRLGRFRRRVDGRIRDVRRHRVAAVVKMIRARHDDRPATVRQYRRRVAADHV